MIPGLGMARTAAKYAAYMVLCCIVYKACEKCVGKMCKQRDPWNITEEVQGTEIAAGHVFKPDSMLGMWGEYYAVVRDNMMIFYADQTRTVLRGEFVLVGSTAERNATRVDDETKLYFVLSHPDCGIREFYVTSEQRREQWLTILSATANNLRSSNKCIFGMLSKIGGITKSNWDERWCICSGPTLAYYVQKTDDLPNGTLYLVGANIRQLSHRGKTHCIEIVQDKTAVQSRKGSKKYIFAMESAGAQNQWLEVLKRSANAEETENPILAAGGASGGAAGGSVQMTSTGLAGKGNGPEKPTSKMRGYLEKKQKSIFGGWQKRYFVLDPSGDKWQDIKVLYFETQEKADSNGSMKGFLALVDIANDRPKRDGATDFTFVGKGKAYTLRAPSPQDRDEWVREMNCWIEYAVALKETRASMSMPLP